jgi:hypothetical protein
MAEETAILETPEIDTPELEGTEEVEHSELPVPEVEGEEGEEGEEAAEEDELDAPDEEETEEGSAEKAPDGRTMRDSIKKGLKQLIKIEPCCRQGVEGCLLGRAGVPPGISHACGCSCGQDAD